MTQPSAKVIADSLSPAGHRLTTIEATFHRFVLAEVNTHRAFSRNSASSRAIPVKKQLERVMNDPAIPVSFPREQKGMQGGEDLDGLARFVAEMHWLQARDVAVEYASLLTGNGVHKSVVNRLLEPFMWHTAIISATDWDGFWAQRCSPLAQPELRVVAEAMKAAYDASTPTLLEYGQWHLPYIQPDEHAYHIECKKQISVARCARVSYLTHGGVRDANEDRGLYSKLVSADPPHASPLEHVATPNYNMTERGNFQGWDQLRHLVLAA